MLCYHPNLSLFLCFLPLPSLPLSASSLHLNNVQVLIIMLSLGLQGIDICREMQLIVTNTPKEFNWDGYGLKVHIQENSLPVGINQMTLNIVASIAGHYEFPENCHLVSAVYWFCCEEQCALDKEVVMEIQHCAKSESTSKLKFVEAVCTQDQLPYTFTHQERGEFSCDNTYGKLRLCKFSGLAIIQEGDEDRNYLARLFYICPSPKSFEQEIHFVITLSTEAHITVS